MLGVFKRELSLQLGLFKEAQIQQIHIGGGTPSSAPQQFWVDFFAFMKEKGVFKNKPSFTFECNVEDIKPELLTLLQENGVSRISLGVQSLDDDLLRKLNRKHNAQQALKAIDEVKSYGFECNIDYLRLKHPSFWSGLETLLPWAPEHWSIFPLVPPENSSFDAHEFPDLTAFSRLQSILSDCGYEHYESNHFARKGHFNKTNFYYLHHQAVINIGPAAVGFKPPAKRLINASSVETYLSELSNCIQQVENLNRHDLKLEWIMNRLRTKEGLCKATLSSFFDEKGQKKLANFFRHKFAHLSQEDESHYRLTEAGLFYYEHILTELVDELSDQI